MLARDPYCAWSPAAKACVTLHQAVGSSRYDTGEIVCVCPVHKLESHVCLFSHRGWIQEMSGDTSSCLGELVSFAS